MATNYTITSRPSFPHSRDMIRGARKDQKQMDTPVNNPMPITAPAADPTVVAPVDVAPAADPVVVAPVDVVPAADPAVVAPVDVAPAADPVVVAPVEDVAPAADSTPVEAPAAPIVDVVAAPVEDVAPAPVEDVPVVAPVEDAAPAVDPAPVEAPVVDPIADTPVDDAVPAADPTSAPVEDVPVVAPVEDAVPIFDSWSPSYAADSEIVEATISEDVAPVVDETSDVEPATITVEGQDIRQPSIIIQDMEDLADELATYIIHMSDNYPSDNIEILTDTFSDLAKAVRELKKLCS